MKKNTAIKLGMILLAITLITGCFISGTLAKYVTTADNSDTARVAKWGVTAAINGGAFATSYAKDDETFTVNAETVVSNNEDKLVAPGTEGVFTGVALTGTPEVAVRITKEAVCDVEGWLINTNEYYCPLVVTIDGTALSGLDYDSADAFEAAIVDAIENATGDYAANTDLSAITSMNGDYSWAWAFDGDGVDQTDVKDTALGDLETAPSISLEVSVSVVQID